MGRQVREGLDGFKETEIGLLPEDWEVIRLEEIFHVKQGKSLSSQRRQGINQKPFLRTANVLWGKIDLSVLDQMDFSNKEIEQLKLQPGDLLVCEGGEIGRTAIWNGELDLCCYQNHLHRLRKKRDDIYPLFYMYWMQAAFLILNLYGGVGNKTTIANLSQSRLKSFLLVKPPTYEQRKISHVLSTIQRAVEQQDKIIAAARELKKSLMRHLFTYGPVPVDQVGRVPLKETEIGTVPKDWEVVRLGECLSIIRNGITKKQNKEGLGYPVTRIETIGDEKINALKIGWVDQLSEKEREKFQVRKNDILFSHINSELHLGKVAIYKGQPPVLIHGMNLLLMRTNKQLLNPDFLFHLFKYYRTQGTFVGIASRAVNQSSINQGKMKALLIPLPPLPEQRQIARILSTVDKKIEVEEKRKASLQSLFQTMLHLLMTGRVRVKDLEVNVRDAGL